MATTKYLWWTWKIPLKISFTRTMIGFMRKSVTSILSHPAILHINAFFLAWGKESNRFARLTWLRTSRLEIKKRQFTTKENLWAWLPSTFKQISLTTSKLGYPWMLSRWFLQMDRRTVSLISMRMVNTSRLSLSSSKQSKSSMSSVIARRVVLSCLHPKAMTNILAWSIL